MSIDISVQRIKDYLIISPQDVLKDSRARIFINQVLEIIDSSKVRGVILDLINIDIVDSFLGRTFSELVQSVNLQGVKIVLVGMKPDIAITMVEMGLSFGNIKTAINLDSAIKYLESEK